MIRFIRTFSSAATHSKPTTTAATHSNPTQFDVVVVGGGAAGLAVSSRLLKSKKPPSVAIIDPSDYHYYQPGFSLAGGCVTTRDLYRRDQESLIPKGATWLKNKVSSFKPEENKVLTDGGVGIEYKYLVIAPGVELKFDAIGGLREALDDPTSGVSTIYSFDYVAKTANLIWCQNQPGDSKPIRAVFTQPAGQIKCAGAPQKIMYLAESFWREHGAREKTTIEFYTGLPILFSHPEYAKELNKICDKRKLNRFYSHDLIGVESKKKEAIFQKTVDGKKENVAVKYDILHVTPKQSTGNFLKTSSLVDADGFVDVDKHSLQHKKYSNVFGLGDASNVPTSKTAAAITKQAPVVASNILNLLTSKPVKGDYNGYTSCALLISDHEVMLAEFLGPGYGLQRKETFPVDQRIPRRSMFYLKRDVFPNLYFNGLVKGTWPPPIVSSFVGGIPKRTPPPPKAHTDKKH